MKRPLGGAGPAVGTGLHWRDEKDFQAWITGLAQSHGWWAYRNLDANPAVVVEQSAFGGRSVSYSRRGGTRTTEKGMVDIFCLDTTGAGRRPKFWEIKWIYDSGRRSYPTPEQRECLALLALAFPTADVRVLYPTAEDLEYIRRELAA